MERRHFKRIAFGIRAKIIVHGKSINAVIEDLSETGLNIITDPVEDAAGFVQGADMELRFRPVDEELIVLNGKIKWVRTAYPKSSIYKIGITLENPPWDESSCFV